MDASRECGIDTKVAGAPQQFSAVGISLSDIDRIPMVIRHRRWPWPEDSIHLFGKDAQAHRHGAQVFIQLYPLPEGTEKFHEGLALYRNQKKGFLVEGRRFDPSFLLPRSVAAGFERQSFQTRDGANRRRIVHLFSSPRRAIILVYSLNSAYFASSLFFRQVSGSLVIGE